MHARVSPPHQRPPAHGDLDTALAEAEDAVTRWQELGMPLELGRALITLAQVQRRRAARRAARDVHPPELNRRLAPRGIRPADGAIQGVSRDCQSGRHILRSAPVRVLVGAAIAGAVILASPWETHAGSGGLPQLT